MNFKEDTRLVYLERPDLSPFLVHLTKATDRNTGFDNLLSILKDGSLKGSTSSKGFIKGGIPAVCFMDVPLGALKYVLDKANTNPNFPRYGPYGIVVSKAFAHKRGARPALYLSDKEVVDLKVPPSELWRVVRFEGVSTTSKGWLHEREWRAKQSFQLPSKPLAVLVKSSREARKLEKAITESTSGFNSVPKSILPLIIVCQGLPYTK